jgi:hypothetical protein
MLERCFGLGLASSLFLAVPTPLVAQGGPNIDHKTVGCIVVGKYPKLNACFTPASQLARARVYFRPEEGPPNWYYVEMQSDAPCHAGVLPKPKKVMAGKNVLYYVNAFNQRFEENRTGDTSVRVVNSESECEKDIPIAPFLQSAAVRVFPSIPAGFAAGGIGTATVVAAVAGGAAVVGGGVALASGSDGTTTTTTQAVIQQPTTTTVTTTATTTTTTTMFAFNPVFKVFQQGSAVPDDARDLSGPDPVGLRFDMCESTSSSRLFYDVYVNGLRARAGCLSEIIFTASDFNRVGRQGVGSSQAPPQYNIEMTMQTETGDPRARRRLTLEVTTPSSMLPAQSRRVNLLSSRPLAERRLAWASLLDVPDASGQVVVNGTTAVFAGPGQSTALAIGRRGENRVEAQLVQASGRPGLWRFEFGTTASLEPGSLRVIAGQAALVTADAIVFRMSGRPGERVVFAFRAGR